MDREVDRAAADVAQSGEDGELRVGLDGEGGEFLPRAKLLDAQVRTGREREGKAAEVAKQSGLGGAGVDAVPIALALLRPDLEELGHGFDFAANVAIASSLASAAAGECPDDLGAGREIVGVDLQEETETGAGGEEFKLN